MATKSTAEERVNVTQAAKILGVSRKTIHRMVQKKELKRGTDELFALDDVEELRGVVGEEEESDAQALIVSQLKEGHEQALQHAERMFKLIEAPLQTITGALTATLDKMNAREQSREETHLEMMQIVGDLLMRKAERDNLERQGEAKTKMMAQAGSVALSQVPVLIEQFSKRNLLVDFAKSLNAEEREGIWQLAGAFDEPSKQAAFEALLKAAGLEKPRPKESENAGNQDQ